MKKLLVIRSMTRGFIVSIALCGILIPYVINADMEHSTLALNSTKPVKKSSAALCNLDKSSSLVVKKIKVVITAYSSTPDQTDDTPFITASGKRVADGIIANNMLPFGTKVRIPSLYGGKIFIVQDRMHQRKGKYQVDIWMSDHQQAKNFGAKITDIEVLQS